MPYSTSYITASTDMSLEDRRAARNSAQQWLIKSAAELRVRFNEQDLLVRDIFPNTDVGLAAQQDWLIAGAGVVGTELQYIATALTVDRLIAFYGCGSLMATPNLSMLRLTQGAASATTRGQYQLEKLWNREDPNGFFSEPVGFLRQETPRAMVMPKVAFAANTERLVLHGRVLEPIGGVISTPSI